jgi:hypothetical protein
MSEAAADPGHPGRKLLVAAAVFAALAALTFILEALGGHSGKAGAQGTPSNYRHVTASEFGAAWPLTVTGGTLICQPTIAGGLELHELFFMTDDRIHRYALNGTAKSLGLGQDISPIWKNDPAAAGVKMDMSRLTDTAAALCTD